MKYNVRVNNCRFPLELQLNENLHEARCNKQNYQFEIEKISREHFVARLRGTVYDILISGQTMLVNGKPCQIQIENVRLEKLRGLLNAAQKKKGPHSVKAPMPGLVLRVLVEEGQKVGKNDGLLIIEAMKMENEIRSEHDCLIKKIHVHEKQIVEKDELLIQLE